MNAFELYFDGKRFADLNNIHERNYRYADVTLQAGKLYPIRLDYHEFVGDATIRLVWSRPGGTRNTEALEAARTADASILVLGLSPRLEGEEMSVPVEGFRGGDRVSIDLPRAQEDLLQKIAELNKPLVLVLLNGSALAVNWARDHVPAIVEAWYPGQAGGDAIADVLFGDYNPAGRLPVTFYRSADQVPPFTDYHMTGRTYRYFNGEPLYPFGYGLSYTTFTYRNLKTSGQIQSGDAIKVSAEVENTGKRGGEEVVQVYFSEAAVPGMPPSVGPLRSLVGFRRIYLRPGEKRLMEFTIEPRQIAQIQGNGTRRLVPGAYVVYMGGKQPGFSGPQDAATTALLMAPVRILGAIKAIP